MQGVNVVARSVGSLVNARGQGRVHSTFRRALNIELPDGTLLTLLGANSGKMPRGISCQENFDFSAIAPADQRAVFADGKLLIPEVRLSADLSKAEVFSGEMNTIAMDPEAPNIRNALALLGDRIRALRAPLGLCSELGQAATTGKLSEALSSQVSRAMALVNAGITCRDANALESGFSKLIGLGVGLTPSGDDFIVGIFGAMFARSRRTPSLRALLEEVAPRTLALLGRTNAISAQFLRDAVMGHFSEELLGVVRAIADGESGGLQHCIDTALEVGHTSGLDMLTGLMFGLEAV